jgi:hypothetical protein
VKGEMEEEKEAGGAKQASIQRNYLLPQRCRCWPAHKTATRAQTCMHMRTCVTAYWPHTYCNTPTASGVGYRHREYKHMDIYVYIYMHIRIHIRICIRMCIYTCTYTYTRFEANRKS